MSTQARDPQDLLPLTHLVFHILLSLAGGPRHGYAIVKDIEKRTDGRMRPGSGTLYLAIQRLQEGGVIEEWDDRPDADADDERRRYYLLTGFGRAVAAAEANRLAVVLREAQAHDLLTDVPQSA